MQFISVFLAIAKSGYFRWKNADVSGTQEICLVIHMNFKSFLGKI